MRAAIAIHSIQAIGGAERITAMLATDWSKRGWEVTIITIAGASENPYLLPDNVQIVPLNLSSDSKNFFQGLVSNLRRIFAVRRTLRAYQPDFVLGMMTMTNIIVALAGIGLDCRTIGSERTYPPKAPISRLWNRVRCFAYGLLDTVIAQTPETADWIRTNTYARCIAIVPNAVSWPLVQQKPIIVPDSLIPADARLIIAVGRLHELKGFHQLLEAFSRIAPSHPALHLAIIGEGSEQKRLEKAVIESGLVGRVSLPGRLGNLGDWYERASIFALTSRYEGFPNVVLEAMSYRLPAVSFDCDVGPRNIVRDGVDGFLVPVGDIEALAGKLALLAENEALRNRMGNAAQDVRNRFSPQRILEDWNSALTAVGLRVKSG